MTLGMVVCENSLFSNFVNVLFIAVMVLTGNNYGGCALAVVDHFSIDIDM